MPFFAVRRMVTFEGKFMSLPQKTSQKYTYEDYLTWPDEERWELIEGTAYDMSPAPTTRHQMITGRFYSRLERALAGNHCRVFIAPTDVVFSENDVVQPDVLVVCDLKKITEKNIRGAPEMVVEVLSPETALKDRREKKFLYEKYGVKEYIIIDPLEHYLERFLLQEDGSFSKGEIFGPEETFSPAFLEGIEISLGEVFEMEML